MEDYLRIRRVRARTILDSRGNPTIEAVLSTPHYTTNAAVPSGASTGSYEARELRDNKKAWNGLGVEKAIRSVDAINKKVKGMLVVDQERIDAAMRRLDGTPDKSRLGANAILAVSLASAKSAALHTHKPLHTWLRILRETKTPARLPVPFANVLNGGRHAANALRFQEFMLAPVRAKSFSRATELVAAAYHELGTIIRERYGSAGVGDEGGYAPPITTPEDALHLLEDAVSRTSSTRAVRFAIDAAASEFHNDRAYTPITGVKPMTTQRLLDYYEDLLDHYPIMSIEDPFHEDDFSSYARLLERAPKNVQIVTDDLTATNPERISTAIAKKSGNTLLLKMNQIGTLTETFQAAELAQRNGWNVMVSHRSGETEDPFIADLAVALGTGQIKLGAPARGERTAKYNQLLRIEDTNPKMAYGFPR